MCVRCEWGREVCVCGVSGVSGEGRDVCMYEVGAGRRM